MERILSIATERASEAIPTQGRRAVVDRAVWFCACVTDNGADAPTWLIYDTDNGGLGWCRVGNDDDMDDLVDANEIFGDHVHPGQVAEWLQGADPRRVFGLGDAEELRELGRKIRELHED